MNNFIKKYLFLAFAIILINGEVVGQASRPNILLILMDDLGYSDVGFMPDAASDIHTPNLDLLANQGTVFTSAYVTHPFCGPSRTSIMTGRAPHDLGAQFNLAAFSGNGINAEEKFISKVLDEADYYTGLIGKWHLGEETEFHPNSRGFDYFYGFLGGGHEYFSNSWLNHSTYDPSNYSVGNYTGDYKRPMMENSDYVASASGAYCTDVLTDAGIQFIENASQNTEPFFLFLSYNAPHTPVQAMQSDINEIKTELGNNAAPDGSERLTYTAMMYNVDNNVQRLVNQLKSTGEYDNTLIIFLSDNGGKTSRGALNSPLRGGKGDAYEGGFRVPMFFHWPNGNVPQAYTHSSNFSSLDFYPTFAFLAGATIPESKIYDGLNVWDDIINKSNPRADVPVFVMRQHNGSNYTGIVENNFKLYTPGNGRWFLYNLTNDIAETTDLSAQYPEIVASMKEAAYQWTWSHIRPEFFDNPSYGFEDSWSDTNMPNFGKTFGDLYDPNDYDKPTNISIQSENLVDAYIYPNPVSNTLYIEFDSSEGQKCDAALYDMSGRLLQLQLSLGQSGNGAFVLPIDNVIPNGSYIFKASIGEKSCSKSIIVSR